jgi:hypothetical protein
MLMLSTTPSTFCHGTAIDTGVPWPCRGKPPRSRPAHTLVPPAVVVVVFVATVVVVVAAVVAAVWSSHPLHSYHRRNARDPSRAEVTRVRRRNWKRSSGGILHTSTTTCTLPAYPQCIGRCEHRMARPRAHTIIAYLTNYRNRKKSTTSSERSEWHTCSITMTETALRWQHA